MGASHENDKSGILREQEKKWNSLSESCLRIKNETEYGR